MASLERSPRLLLSVAASSLGASCADLDVTHPVDPDGQVCLDEAGVEIPLCGRPVTLLHAAPAEGAEVLFGGGADGRLHRITGISETGEIEGESRSISLGFAELGRLLSCDLDGQGAPELVYSGNDSLDSGFLMWDGQLDEDPTRSSLVPAGPLWKAACLDVDGDGVTDLVGTDDDANLLVYRGGPQGFEPTPNVVPLEIAAVGAFTEADITRVAGCSDALLAILSYRLDEGGQPVGVNGVAVLGVHYEGAEVVEQSLLPFDAVERPVVDIRFFAFDDGQPLLAVTTRDRDGTDPAMFMGETLELFVTDGCSTQFNSVGTVSFSQVRRLHQRLGTPSQFLAVGNEDDGVALLQAHSDGPPTVVQRWHVPAIDADIVQLDERLPSDLVASYAQAPYLERLPLLESGADR